MAASQQEAGRHADISCQMQLSGRDSDVLSNIRAADYNSQVTEMTLSGWDPPPPPPTVETHPPLTCFQSAWLSTKTPALGFFTGEVPARPLALPLPLLLAPLTRSEIPTHPFWRSGKFLAAFQVTLH